MSMPLQRGISGGVRVSDSSDDLRDSQMKDKEKESHLTLRFPFAFLFNNNTQSPPKTEPYNARSRHRLMLLSLKISLVLIVILALAGSFWWTVSISTSSRGHVFHNYRRLPEQLVSDLLDIGEISAGPSKWKELEYCNSIEESENYVPCFNLSESLDRFCGSRQECLVSPPVDYKVPLRWPTGKDVIWYHNVKITADEVLTSGSINKRMMMMDDDQISFRSASPMFDEVEDYSHQIAQMIGIKNDNFIEAGVSHTHTHSVLDELRSMTVKSQGQSDGLTETTSREIVKTNNVHEKSSQKLSGDSFRVERTKEWLEKTTSHVNKLLCETFPHILIHPAGKIRWGFLAAIRGLLSKSPRSLKGARLVMLECVCTLVVDDSDEVSVAAQETLDHLFSERSKYHVESDMNKIFSRLLERLPKVVLGNEELPALSVVKQLLVVTYYSGPQFLADHLQSPITASRFLDTFALCLSHNSAFTGSLEKLIADRPTSSTGYLPSITELKAGFRETRRNNAEPDQGKLEISQTTTSFVLPRMPPWFSYVGSQKLYEMLAGILRLVGLSSMAGLENDGNLAVILDIPLGFFRRLVSEVRVKEYNGEDWQTWCNRTGSGQVVRQTATAACILNEMVFGLSEQATDALSRLLRKKSEEGRDNKLLSWEVSWNKRAKTHLIDCVGKILHEYQSPEVWDIPVDQTDVQQISLHFLRDTAMLHQVIIEGVGVFSLCLVKTLLRVGFFTLRFTFCLRVLPVRASKLETLLTLSYVFLLPPLAIPQ